MEPPTMSVVVPTSGRPDLLEACLDSLSAQRGALAEVIVVDDSGSDPRLASIAERAGARYAGRPGGGSSGKRNRGAQLATGAVVAFVDDDARAEPAWADRLRAAFADDSVMVATGRILAPEEAAGDEPAEGDLGTRSFTIDRGGPFWFEQTAFGGAGLGPNMAFRRTLFGAGFRFREDLGIDRAIPGYEEHHAFFEVVRSGGRLVYVPDAIVRHGRPMTAAERRRRHRRILRATAGYLVLLVVEEPGFRRAALRYAGRALTRRERRWQRAGTGPVPRVGVAALVSAAVGGPLDYARSVARRALR